jgi:GNAT superfamily N-acetyltransferase
MNDVKIIALTESDLGKVQMFCGHSPTYRLGYDAKMEWMRARLQEEMRYTLLKVNGRNAGMMEVVPGEYAWRGVEAKGYLFIHCFWVIGQNRGHGYGRQLLQACLEDAHGMNGVAVMVSKTHWLPTPKLFLKNGFELADQASPSFDLLVRRFNLEAPLPHFKQSAQKAPLGLTVYHSDQCPYTQNVPDIATQVGRQMNIPVNILRVDSARAAQESPCPYGTLAYYYNGELLTYHPTGTTKLLEMIEPLLASKTRSK